MIFSIRSIVDFGGFGRDESAKLVLEVQFFFLQQLPFPSMSPLFGKKSN